MKFIGLMSLVALWLLGSTVAFKYYETKDTDPVAGKSLYENHCLSCHGVAAQGNGPLASTLPSKPSNLSDKLESLFVIDSILLDSVVMKGKPLRGMPAFRGVISEAEGMDVFAYIRTLKDQ